MYLADLLPRSGPSRRVAIKLLRADLDRTDEAVRRLRDEGRLLSVLEHPALVRVEDMVVIEGRVGLLMEYVEGADLRRCLAARLPIPPTVGLEIAEDVADALHAAMTMPSPRTGRPLRLVHRDIKPGNIVLSKAGRVRLLDFGVARTHELERETQTRIGEIPLTLGYAAPEVLLSRVQQPPADVFALGVTLYHVFAQEKLFKGLTLADQMALLGAPRKYQAWLTGRLDRVGSADIVEYLGAMLAWSVSDRFTARQVRIRSRELRQQVHGPTLAAWVQAVDLPAPPRRTDLPLVGRVVLQERRVGFAVEREQSTGSAPPRVPSHLARQAHAPQGVPREEAGGGLGLEGAVPAAELASPPEPDVRDGTMSLDTFSLVTGSPAEEPPDEPVRGRAFAVVLGAVVVTALIAALVSGTAAAALVAVALLM